MNIKKLTFQALAASLICIFAPLSFYFGAVPFSLATFAVMLVSALFKPVSSVTCTVIYIMLGAIGLPVFSGFIGGFQQLAGPTGGFIIGYIPLALITSILADRFAKSKFALPFALAAGEIVCLLCGTAWYMHISGTPFVSALAVCVLPFILPEAVKIAAVCACVSIIKPRIKRFL